MPSAFPGQIPPDRRFTDHEKTEPEISNTQTSSMQNMWLPRSASACDTNSEANNPRISVQDQRQPESLVVRPMSDLADTSRLVLCQLSNFIVLKPNEHSQGILLYLVGHKKGHKKFGAFLLNE